MITPEGNQIAVLANQIIRARHRLDPRQQKVLAWAVAQIARDDSDFLTHTLSISEFAKLTGSDSGSLFREMEAVTKSLLRAVIEIKENDGDRRRIAFQWLSRCVYRDGEGTVEIRFHDELKPYLLELRSRFTQLRLDQFFRFRSSYTIRFFERIEMERGMGREGWTMTVEAMRDWLGIEAGAYKFFGLFRAKVIDVAQRELDTKGDWSFSFQLVKTGSKITGVEFTIRRSRAPKTDPNRERWKKASPDLRAKVFEAAKTKPRWQEKTDSEIETDDGFWKYLPDLLAEVEQGQRALSLA